MHRHKKDTGSSAADENPCPWCSGGVTTPESMRAKLEATKLKRIGVAFLLACLFAGIVTILPGQSFYLILAVVVLGVCVSTHEAGHLYAAVRGKVMVTEYALGFGMPLAAVTVRGIVVSLRLLPLGGFCAIVGMDGDTVPCEKHRAQMGGRRLFVEASTRRRVWISLAGVSVNLIVAWIAIMVIGGEFGANTSFPRILLIPVIAALTIVGTFATTVAAIGQGVWSLLTGAGKDGLGSMLSLPSQLSDASQLVTLPSWAFGVLMIALMSVSLAGINALPLFPLDGGHVVGTVVDAVRTRRARRRNEPDPGPVTGHQMRTYRLATSVPVISLFVFLMGRDLVHGAIRFFG